MTSRFDPAGLLEHLRQAGVHVRVDDTGRLRLAMPWPPDKAPEVVRPWLRELKAHKAQVAAYLVGQVAPTDLAPAPSSASGYVEKYPEGAAALKSLGYWPYGPIIGDTLPNGTRAMDWRFNEKREVVYDPGWWRNLPPAKLKH